MHAVHNISAAGQLPLLHHSTLPRSATALDRQAAPLPVAGNLPRSNIEMTLLCHTGLYPGGLGHQKPGTDILKNLGHIPASTKRQRHQEQASPGERICFPRSLGSRRSLHLPPLRLAVQYSIGRGVIGAVIRSYNPKLVFKED